MQFLQQSPAKIVAGRSHSILADMLARELGLPLIKPEFAEFADGEARVRITDDVRGARLFIVQSTSAPVNDNLMTLALLVDAAVSAGAAHVTAIVPYFGYARQDQRSYEGEPRSAQVAARLLGMVGVGQFVTLDLHSPALESALPMPAVLLPAVDVFAARIKNWGASDFVIVSPDAGGVKRAQQYARALGAAIAVVRKQRLHADEATPQQVLGDVDGRTCIVVDDIAAQAGLWLAPRTPCASLVRRRFSVCLRTRSLLRELTTGYVPRASNIF
jgi:ribose-phosphate pyrophosphokinase